MPAQVPREVGIERSIPDSASEPGHLPRLPHLSSDCRVLPSEAEVKHVARTSGGGRGTNSKVGGFDVSMEEAAVMERLDGRQDLNADPEGGGDRELLVRLVLAELRQAWT